MTQPESPQSSRSWVTTTLILEGLAKGGDDPAWAGFVRYFRPILLSFARRAGLAQEQAEDFTQQCLLEFYRAYQSGHYDRQKGRLSHWLFGIARKVLAQTFRKRRPERVAADLHRSDEQPFEGFADPAAEQDLWQKQWEQMVLQICLDRARGEFDEKTFVAFEQYALRERDPEAVAKDLGMSRNAVYIAKSRVLSRVRELIQEFEEK